MADEDEELFDDRWRTYSEEETEAIREFWDNRAIVYEKQVNEEWG